MFGVKWLQMLWYKSEFKLTYKASKERASVVENSIFFFLCDAILQRNVKWLCELNTLLQLLYLNK